MVAVCAAAPVAAQQVRALAESAADRCARWLPPAVVARVAGSAGVQLVPYEPRTGAGAECNYAGAGDTLLLALDVERHAWAAARFGRLRTGPHARQHQQPVAGLGDEAFTYGAFGEYLVARRGDTVVRLTSWSATDPRAVRAIGPLLSRDQLIGLARRVLGTP